ncbi:orotidine 5'-phosphate decarboxylase [Pseudohyphozyma bogoriensis]|nr:orotidine 5'-phosphate decarboxylase [Pseudohyphozyma bogoriensis]
MSSIVTTPYSARAETHPVAIARTLLATIARKSTNLCVSVDVTKKDALLRIVDAAGPHCCVIKTHIDIVDDFDDDLVAQLKALSEKHDFLIWEDRKFADIGNTVKLQYSSGVYKIASWAHITNAHPIPGDGIVTSLASVGLPLSRGLLLMAGMSSAGNLATGAYTAQTVEMAKRHKDFCMGFVVMDRKSVGGDVDWLILTPGVGLDTKGDGAGQQYRTPEEVIKESGCDVIIVGRGIYGGGDGDPSEKIVEQAKRYKEAGWKAYEERLKA